MPKGSNYRSWPRCLSGIRWLALLACGWPHAQAQTTFSAHFNNGTGSSGDKNAGLYNWTAAIGGGGTLDNTLSGAPASVGVSQGVTSSSGVPVISGESTSAGFLFALPDAAPGAMLLHTTSLATSTTLQDAPQSGWFRSGSDALSGLTLGRIAQLSANTRPASSTTIMRFAILVGGQWHVSVQTFTQGNLNSYELKTLTHPSQVSWHPAVFTSGSFLDSDPSDNPQVTLGPDAVVGGYGIHAQTGSQNNTAARVRIDSFQITASPATSPSGAIVTLAGNSGTEEFRDVMQLSDGTVLVAGSAENLDWITAPKIQWSPMSIPNRNTGRTAFVMRLTDDLSTILGVWHLPPGQARDFRWIKGTHKPGDATGALYLSGACDTVSGDYFIARLDSNFIAAPATGFSWVKVAKASGTYGDNLGLQPWDVGGDGRVVFLDETGGNMRVFALDATGQLMKLPALRGSHWTDGVALDAANRQEGVGADLPATTVSGITFPTDLRSWNDTERLAILADGNGQIKRGTWPLDLFTPVRDRNGGTSGTIEYGYTGYKSVGKFRVGGIAVDRETNDFSIGFNIQSRFWDVPANKEQPDFEPAVISYAADGALKWWSRLYHEVVDANSNGQVDSGETRLSSPDQYVDGLAIDYSTTPRRLVVLARCHGNNTENLWRGNAIAASPGTSSFHNSFTGTEGNIHISWIGKLRESDGTLFHTSYLAGYFRDSTLTQTPYSDPNLDGWPSHNGGWPNLTTTRAEPGSIRTDAAGRVYVAGLGPRMVTTANAWQKLPKITSSINEGISPWAQFVRVMEPALNTLAYSSALTGEWTYPSAGAQPVGADNTDVYGLFPVDGGLIAVGRQRNEGNPVPTVNRPSWGTATPSGISGLLAMLPFVDGGGAPSSLPVVVDPASASPSSVNGISTQLNILASDPNDPEEDLVYTWSVVDSPAGGSVTFTPNNTNAAKQATAIFTRAGSYSLRGTVTDLAGRSASSDVVVNVQASPSGVGISPTSAEVGTFLSNSFTAQAVDQFGQPFAGASTSWSASGGGTISNSGVFTAGSTAGGPHTVTASWSGFSADAVVTIIEASVPRIDLPANSISQPVQTGTSTTRPLRIQSVGSDVLAWSTSAFIPGGGQINSFETSSQPGGPAFGWIDISSGSTTIWAPVSGTSNDDSSALVVFPSGFDFSFYGNTFTQARVCTNGFLTFSSSTSTAFNHQQIPTLGGNTPGNLIAVAWTDWVVDPSAWVKHKLVDPDTFVITWNNVYRFGSAARASFQCILKRNGDIFIQIKSFGPTDRKYTVGIQNADATQAVLASYNPATNFIPTGTSSNFAVRFPVPSAVPAWLSIQPAAGATAPPGTDQPGLLFDASGLAAGTYEAIIRVSSNDPVEPVIDVPVVMTVGSAPVAPNAPLALTATPADTGAVLLEWSSDGGGATGHQAEFRLSGAPAWLPGPAFAGDAVQALMAGLTPGAAYEFRVIATNAAGDSPPSNIASATLPQVGFAAWIASQPGVGDLTGPTEDPDNDKIPSLVEYALAGGQAGSADPGILPIASFTTDGGSDYLTLTIQKNPDAAGITLAVEVSGNLIDWNAGAGHTVVISDTEDTLVVRDATPVTAGVVRFIRLKVNQ